jgi:hypothetical protein
MRVNSHESEQSCVSINFASFYDFSIRLCGILEMFRQCGILELFRQCGILELFRQCGILKFRMLTMNIKSYLEISMMYTCLLYLSCIFTL